MLNLACPSALLLREIGDFRYGRRAVAKTYRAALLSSQRDRVDWQAVDNAILRRWGVEVLKQIREQAMGVRV